MPPCEASAIRMLAAVHTPGVHVLAHPRGRMSDSRPGITAAWDRVFEEPAARVYRMKRSHEGPSLQSKSYDHGTR